MTTAFTTDDVKDIVKTLRDDAFREVMYWIVTDEKKRRESASVFSEGQISLILRARELDPTLTPVTGEDGVCLWREPGSVLAAYLPGEVVEHDGVEYRSVATGPNMDTPGVGDGWEEVLPEPEPEEVPLEEPADGLDDPGAMDLPEDPAPED